jgi:radical SAM protein with 4Fe4S-binding SPASM domain
MTAITRELSHEQSAAKQVRTRLRHFMREVGDRVVRYHLRVDPDGSGIVIANASAAVRLSETGVFIAERLLQRRTPEDVAFEVKSTFAGVSHETAMTDVRRVRETIDAMGLPSSAFPLSTLDAPTGSLHRRVLSAPLAADLPVHGMGHAPEVLRRLWDLGVPQVTFVLPSGAATSHLAPLVEVAEDLGLIAGVRARATDIAKGGILRELAQLGVDHVDVYWTGTMRELHDGFFGEGDHALAEDVFARCHALEVCPVAVVPLLDATMEVLDALGEALAAQRVEALVAFAIADEEGAGQVLAQKQLPQLATTLEEISEHHDLNLVFAPPVERDPTLSLAAQVRDGLRTSGEACVRIEEDGSVLAPIGPPVSAGNILHDPWDAIWAHEAFAHWRTSVDEPPRCAECPGLALCDGGCPKDRATWARVAKGGAR